MTIVRSDYRPKRAPRKKRKQPPLAQAIVTPAPMKKGPPRHVTRLGQAEAIESQKQEPAPHPVIVTPRRKPGTSIFGDAPDMTPEEHRRRGDAAEALFREIVRRAKRKSE
jgi:hypothetical protein